MYKINHLCGLFLSLVFVFPIASHAYSGAGESCDNDGSLLQTAMNGLPSDLDREIDVRAARIENAVSKWSREQSASENETASLWRDPKIINGAPEVKRTAFVGWWRNCGGVTLLDGAVAGANIENIKRLIALGADANILSRKATEQSLFMRCPVKTVHGYFTVGGNPPKRTKEEEVAVIAAYSLLLSVGADVNQISTRGYTALHYCKDPLVVDFLLKNGADVYVYRKLYENAEDKYKKRDFSKMQVLDYRVEKIVTGYESYWDNDFDVLRLIMSYMNKPQLADATEDDLLWRCKYPKYKEVCRRLSTLITFRNQEIYAVIGQ